MRLERVVVDLTTTETSPSIVLFHGFMSLPADLSPFADTLGLDACFVFPQGLLDLAPLGLRGHAWWLDEDQGAPEARTFPDRVPDGLDVARACIDGFIEDIRRERPNAPLIVGGFSQGAMLTLDWTLRTERRPVALVQLSGAPMCRGQWAPRFSAGAGQRVFFSHGRGDPELAFDAIDSLQAELAASGWDVTFCAFDGGHEVPFVPLRALKKFLRTQCVVSPRTPA